MCHEDGIRRGTSGLFVLLIAFFGGISISFGQTQAETARAEKIAKSTITYQIIGSDIEGYGYDVFADGKLTVHQPVVPGQPGNKGFRTKADSEKVARLVVEKLKKRELPPTVSVEELRTLKVID
ncbi:MAG TPA: DUF4907 domain-containing protein [Cyclobacteriaceae bacterium]|nr:DUF4907 domain-containing protein [Cyclobacteriaceae bacterium]